MQFLNILIYFSVNHLLRIARYIAFITDYYITDNSESQLLSALGEFPHYKKGMKKEPCGGAKPFSLTCTVRTNRPHLYYTIHLDICQVFWGFILGESELFFPCLSARITPAALSLSGGAARFPLWVAPIECQAVYFFLCGAFWEREREAVCSLGSLVPGIHHSILFWYGNSSPPCLCPRS